MRTWIAKRTNFGDVVTMAKFVSVSSVDDDGAAAASDAAHQLVRQLGGRPDWVLTFFSAEFAPEAVVRGLARKIPADVPLVGCSSFAEVDGAEAMTRSVVLLGARNSGLVAHPFSLPADGRTSFELGQEVGRRCRPLSPSLLILLPDVLSVNATQLLRGIQAELGNDAPIVGGAAADSGSFKRTHQLCGGALQTDGLAGMMLCGPLQLVTAARSGYTPVSIPHIANRVENGNVLLELDGRPALTVYREFLGPRAGEMPSVSIEFPIGVVPQGATETLPDLTRAIFRVDEARGALILGGDVEQGAKLRILSATRADVLNGARAATEQALQAMPQPDLALIFSCISRKVVLGGHYRDEATAALQRLPAQLPIAGFYTFGELSPVERKTEHHESTFTLALLKAGAQESTG